MTVRELIATFRPFVQPHSWRIAAGTALVLAGTATGLLRPWPLKYLFDNVLAGDATPASARVALLLVAATIAAATANKGNAEFAAMQNQEDAPPCTTCGSIMVRSGACYKCVNCGNTSGCA